MTKINHPLWLFGNVIFWWLAILLPTQAQIAAEETIPTPNFIPNGCPQVEENFFSSLSRRNLAVPKQDRMNLDGESEDIQRVNILFNSNNELNPQLDRLASTTNVCQCTVSGWPGRWVWLGGRYVCLICPVPY